MTHHPRSVLVICAGLAGSEAAWQLAIRGIDVDLVEMRPVRSSPAHHTADFAELVCSNSFKSDDPATAAGALKRELEMLGSLVMWAARRTAIPAGAALAVDRLRFSSLITSVLRAHPRITVHLEEATAIPADRPVIVATGPLTAPALEPALSALIGQARLHFFDAAAPIVDGDSIDRTVAFAASRYGKGTGADYLNCPLDRERYERFVDALLTADRVILKDFELRELFAQCQPIEEIARQGRDALRFGPLKPVGLTDPRTGARPWAVLQLRPENHHGTAYNLVGCQTNLTFGAQQRVFRLVPGLENVEFLRYGVMHRNTFVDAPRTLDETLAVRRASNVRLAGQLTGTEGYLEAAATGLLAALATVCDLTGTPFQPLPPSTVLGALIAYVTDPATGSFQPMHVNIGLLPPLEHTIREKRARRAALLARAHDALREYVERRADLIAPARTALGHLVEGGVPV